jgi:hypothetical protein
MSMPDPAPSALRIELAGLVLVVLAVEEVLAVLAVLAVLLDVPVRLLTEVAMALYPFVLPNRIERPKRGRI